MKIKKDHKFTQEELIKKFHWLIQSGLTSQEEAERIKQESSSISVHQYVNAYTNAVGEKA